MNRVVRFLKDAESKSLLLEYSPSFNFDVLCARLGVTWDAKGNLNRCSPNCLPEELVNLRGSSDQGLELRIKKVFHFTQDDLLEASYSSEELIFILAEEACLDGFWYYRVRGRILDIPQDVFISSDRMVTQHWLDFFCTGYERRTSVFKKISEVISPSEPRIVIGGEADCSIPWKTFEKMLAHFPTTRELELLGKKMLSDCIEGFLAPRKDYRREYRSYRKRLLSAAGEGDSVVPLGSEEINLSLGSSLLESIHAVEKLLERGEEPDETEWQKTVFRILPAIFPQYIAALREVVVPETFSKKGRVTERKLDYVLIDASGNIDLIEMKKAFGNDGLIQRRKYRDNWVPARELSGGIVQIEKYIYYLHHLGSQGERKLSDNCKKKLYAQGVFLPEEFTLRCLNPRGILMMGNPKFDEEQQHGFDIIRRQYARVIDIITYDDLLTRLKNMLAAVRGASRSGADGHADA